MTALKKMTQAEALEIILSDLEGWMMQGDSDCSMAYAFRNGYHLHAANLWLGSGASSDHDPKVLEAASILRISPAAETKEIEALCEAAHIYVCPDCNHHAFCDDDEGEEISCSSCGDTAIKQAKASDITEAVKQLFPEAQMIPYGKTRQPAFYVHNEDDSEGFRIIITKGNETSRQGIHLTQLDITDLERRLTDAAETALKDGFQTVWVHA